MLLVICLGGAIACQSDKSEPPDDDAAMMDGQAADADADGAPDAMPDAMDDAPLACNPVDSKGCTEDQACQVNQDGDVACITAGSGTDGADCHVEPCAATFWCVPNPWENFVCRKFCANYGSPAECQPGQLCCDAVTLPPDTYFCQVTDECPF